METVKRITERYSGLVTEPYNAYKERRAYQNYALNRSPYTHERQIAEEEEKNKSFFNRILGRGKTAKKRRHRKSHTQRGRRRAIATMRRRKSRRHLPSIDTIMNII